MSGTMPESEPTAAAVHDLGGRSRFLCERIDTTPHALTEFDRTVNALEAVLVEKGLFTVDELRRGIEALADADYHRLTYYERWLRSILAALLRRGAVTEHELAEAL